MNSKQKYEFNMRHAAWTALTILEHVACINQTIWGFNPTIHVRSCFQAHLNNRSFYLKVNSYCHIFLQMYHKICNSENTMNFLRNNDLCVRETIWRSLNNICVDVFGFEWFRKIDLKQIFIYIKIKVIIIFTFKLKT